MVEYRLAKARVAGSNPVSCFFVAFYLGTEDFQKGTEDFDLGQVNKLTIDLSQIKKSSVPF